MSDELRPPHDPAPGKIAPPGLFARAPRPPVVRIRKGAVIGAAVAAAAILAGALIWAFIVQPELRALGRARPADTEAAEARGAVRPTALVSEQPASYDRLPAPRTLRKDEADGTQVRSPSPRRSPAQSRSAPDRVTLASEARRSELLFTAARPAPGARPAPATALPTFAASAPAAGDLSPPAPPYALLAGSLIPAVLISAVDTSRPGPVAASISMDVFDTVSGRHRLIPQGSRLIGRQETGSRHGDHRAYLVWTRLILPNGASLDLKGAPAVDAEGAVGAPGVVDRRIGPLFLAALAAGAVTTLGQAARDHEDGGALLIDAGDAAAIEAAQVGSRLVDRELAIAPAVRLSAGAPVRVLLTSDLVLEPYRP